MFFIGDVSVNMFAGFESRSDITFMTSHSFRGSAIEDSRFQISLVEGQELQTTLKWRKHVMKDMFSYAKWIHFKYHIDNIDFDLKSLDTIDILHQFSNTTMNLIFPQSHECKIDDLEEDLKSYVDDAVVYVQHHPHSNKQLLRYIKDSLYHIIQNRSVELGLVILNNSVCLYVTMSDFISKSHTVSS